MKKIRHIVQILKPKDFTEYFFLFFIVYIILIKLILLKSFSIDIAGAEHYSVIQQQLLEKYGKLYMDPDSFPFFISFYPPLYPYMMKTIFSIKHINILTDLHQMYVTGRFISFVLFFVVFFILVKLIRLLVNTNARLYLILFLLILLFPNHFYTFRPDSFKVTAYVCFVFFMLKYDFLTNQKRTLYLAMAFGVIGVFFKHDVIIYVGLYFVAHFFVYRKLNKIGQFIQLLLVIFVLFFVGAILTNNNMIDNIFYYNIQISNQYSNLLVLELANFLRLLPLIILAIINARSKQLLNRFIGYYALLAFVFSSILLFRAGSNFNYTYESVFLLLINAGIYFKEKDKLLKAPIILYLSFIIFLNQSIGFKLFQFGEDLNRQQVEFNQNIQAAVQLKKIIKKDIVFFPSSKSIIFNAALNSICGYDFHLDRYTDLYLGKPIESKLLDEQLIKKYDSLFTNGFVRYIVIEDTPKSFHHIQKYYPKFEFLQTCNHLAIFRYKL